MNGTRRGRKSSKRMPSKAKILAEKPKAAIRDIEKQISVLMKRTRISKAEVKYLDYTVANQETMGCDLPWQNAVLYPFQGNGQGFRVGETIQNVNINFRGQIWQDTGNVSGGKVHIYVLQQLDNVSSTFIDARTTYILPDLFGYFTPMCFRNVEDRLKWRTLAHKVYTIKPNGVQDSATTNQINQAVVDFNVKIPNPVFDSGLLVTNVTNHPVQIFVICDWGFVSSAPVGSFNQSGYRLNLQQRMTYTDS